MTITVIEQDAELKETELEVDSEYLFDARVRCDHPAIEGITTSCGAQSYVRATLRSGGELFFCSHHADAVADNLKPLCAEWYSEKSRLIENRKTGSEN
jgi:hypothetical protein